MLFVEFQLDKIALICAFCVICVLKKLLRQPPSFSADPTWKKGHQHCENDNLAQL